MRITRTVIVLSLALAACADGGGNVIEFDEIPQSVEVSIAAGNVTVTGNAAVDTASVETAIDGDATPSLELADGVLRVTDDCADDCRVDYSIAVAEDADVVVSTSEGSVTVSDITGAVTIDAPDGAVTLASVNGDLQVIVGEGDVLGTRLESETATFEVGDGDVDVTFDEVIATLIVATDQGDVTIQLPDGAYVFDTDPEDRTELRIDPTSGAANSVTLATGDGDIIVYRR